MTRPHGAVRMQRELSFCSFTVSRENSFQNLDAVAPPKVTEAVKAAHRQKPGPRSGVDPVFEPAGA